MKKILILGLLVGMGASPVAFSNDSIDEKQHEENCKTMSAFAFMAMGARQNGTPLSSSIDIANGIPDKNERDIAKKIVLDAYDQTKYSSQEYKENSRVEFSNKYMLACMKMYE